MLESQYGKFPFMSGFNGDTSILPVATSCWIVLLWILNGNVTNMSPHVVVTPTMLAENGQRHNVADVVTGFKAGSRVG